MSLTNSDKVELDRIFLKIEDKLVELEEAVVDLRGATGGIAELEQRVTRVEDMLNASTTAERHAVK